MAETFKRPKNRRKKEPVKRIALSPEARKAYEDTIQEREQRDREHAQFLPDDQKGKR